MGNEAQARPLRVGYINVRGLSDASWEGCYRLLNQGLDYLFVAETWFVGHGVHTRDRRFIASTPEPPRQANGRAHGGMYLMGGQHVRGHTHGLRVSKHAITFRHGRLRIAGLYLPPTTMATAEIIALLSSLRQHTAVIGDINTRFRGAE
jgi:hypothetical protein